MNLKLIKIVIQHAPIAGDPDEWVMDIQLEMADGTRKFSSWKSSSDSGSISAIPGVIERTMK